MTFWKWVEQYCVSIGLVSRGTGVYKERFSKARAFFYTKQHDDVTLKCEKNHQRQ